MLSLGLGAFALLAFFGSGCGLMAGAGRALCYSPSAIACGEWWRIVTCHWVHHSESHLMYDVLAFVVLGAVCECRGRRSMLAAMAVSSAAIPVLVSLAYPALRSYSGLSGICSALFGLVVAQQFCDAIRGHDRARIATAASLGALFVGKTAYELLAGVPLFASDLGPGIASVPLAHMGGCLAGFAVGAVSGRRP